MKTMFLKLLGIAIFIGATWAASPVRAEEKGGDEKTVKGEVVDLMCYIDHGAKGEKHKGCATKCIKGGGPVGILGTDNQLYLVVGDHEAINDKLAEHAAETITVKGKVVERNGMKLLENAEIQK